MWITRIHMEEEEEERGRRRRKEGRRKRKEEEERRRNEGGELKLNSICSCHPSNGDEGQVDPSELNP